MIAQSRRPHREHLFVPAVDRVAIRRDDIQKLFERVPAVLVLGVIAPEEPLIVSPAGAAVYVPPVYALVPVKVTACTVDKVSQNGVPA